MNCLNERYSIANLLSSRFSSVVITDIISNDGNSAQMLTLLPFPGMFDEIVMGINEGLKSGGKAAQWQCRVYSFTNGQITAPITYNPVIVCKNDE